MCSVDLARLDSLADGIWRASSGGSDAPLDRRIRPSSGSDMQRLRAVPDRAAVLDVGGCAII
jgi:hypothetical protein